MFYAPFSLSLSDERDETKQKTMNFLEEKILSDGTVKQGNILKIDNFLNHQIDTNVICQIAQELKRRFSDVSVDKVLTIEASGIAIATMVGASVRCACRLCQEEPDSQQYGRKI